MAKLLVPEERRLLSGRAIVCCTRGQQVDVEDEATQYIGV